MTNIKKNIRIIYPSSLPESNKGEFVHSSIINSGFNIIRDYPNKIHHWPHSFGDKQERYNDLLNSIKDPNCVAILCGRGGYGSAELLSKIPWSQLSSCAPKWLVGFSDPCALLFAFFSKLNWPCIHGPMPDSKWWNKNSDEDSKQLFALINDQQQTGSIPLSKINPTEEKLDGWLFGGCLSILCSLLGTDYLPKSFAGSILFLEDIGETPARIMRYWTQLNNSFDFSKINAIIFGKFAELDDATNIKIKYQLAAQTNIPCFSCSTIGHTSPNYPLVLGAQATIQDQILQWSYRRKK
jgi:muramoyltetrapeptide carboxypeptidase